LSHDFYYVSALYALFFAGGVFFEWRRTRDTGADALSIFAALFLLQCALPGVFIYGLLPLVNPASPTTNKVLDHILQSVDLTSALTVLLLSAWFLVFFYIGCALGALFLPSPQARAARPMVVDRRRIVGIVLAGFALTFYTFWLFGDTWIGRYANLILYRAGFEGIERNALNANAFALTQTWSWLSVVALLAVREQKGRGWLWGTCLCVSIALALLGVSRRSLFLPLILAYLSYVLVNRKWYWHWLAGAALPLLGLVAFGKALFAAFAWTGNVASVGNMYESAASGFLRAFSEVGLNILESVGTLLFLHLPPRFGIDHVLSIAQRFPDGLIGLNLQFPERIVRVSTAVFSNANDQDIPPGLAGQMWLDFRIFGPIIWGLLFGLQMSVVQYWFQRTQRTLQASAVFVVVVFIVALPLTTGSYDFTFSIDIIILALALWFSTRAGTVNAAASDSVTQLVHA
jgi:hypothetical protein